MTGRLGSWAIYANLPQAVYACDKSQATVVVVNICNRNNVPALIRIAVSSSSTSPANADYIEYDVELGPKGVLERTGVTVNPGQYIVVQSSVDAVSAVCWGPTIGEDYPVTAIPTAPRWSTESITVYAGTTADVQLKAVDPKGALPITYSLGAGSLPPSTTLSSTGLISGTVSTAGYDTNGVTTTATIQASDGVTVVPKIFNIVRRWKDGLSSANAAPSAEYINGLTGTTTNGTYWIDVGDGPFQVYCLMSAGSGYMLAGKIPARGAYGQPWNYDGARWASTVAFNESECANANPGDALNRLWWRYASTTGFTMSLNTVTNTLTVPRVGVTCLQNFTGLQFNITNLSRSNFMTWMANAGTAASNWDNQPNSNRIGFNRTDISAARMRFGITMNNEADDNSNDSAIGFGTYTNSDTAGLRNVEAGGHSWNPDRRYSYQGFIFVR